MVSHRFSWPDWRHPPQQMGVLLLCRDRTPTTCSHHRLVEQRCYGVEPGLWWTLLPVAGLQLFSPSPGRCAQESAQRPRLPAPFAGAAFHQQGWPGNRSSSACWLSNSWARAPGRLYTCRLFHAFLCFRVSFRCDHRLDGPTDAASPDRDRHCRHARRLRNHARARHCVHLADPRLLRLCRQPACHAPAGSGQLRLRPGRPRQSRLRDGSAESRLALRSVGGRSCRLLCDGKR